MREYLRGRRSLEIRQYAESRGVCHLVHFTSVKNLTSILTNGLVPRSALEDDTVEGYITDELRRDGHPDAICLSIEEINRDMFMAKRRRIREFVLIYVGIRVIWENRCRFCWRNAASQEILRYRGDLGGARALRKMYEDWPLGTGVTNREFMKRPDYLPTRPDAEIQVFGGIGVDRIAGIVVGTDRRKSRLEQDLARRGLNIGTGVCASLGG